MKLHETRGTLSTDLTSGCWNIYDELVGDEHQPTREDVSREAWLAENADLWPLQRPSGSLTVDTPISTAWQRAAEYANWPVSR